MEEQDLREIGISDPQHRRKLLQAARSLPKVTAHSPAARAGASYLMPPGPRRGCAPPILGAPEGSTESCSLLPQTLRPPTVSQALGTVKTRPSLRRGPQASHGFGLSARAPLGSLLNHLSLGQPVLTSGVFPWAARGW